MAVPTPARSLRGTMPACSSSPIDPAIGHLAALAEDAGDGPPGLLAVLGKVADPRHRRGGRHRLAVVLGRAAWPGLRRARAPPPAHRMGAPPGQRPPPRR